MLAAMLVLGFVGGAVLAAPHTDLVIAVDASEPIEIIEDEPDIEDVHVDLEEQLDASQVTATAIARWLRPDIVVAPAIPPPRR